MESISYHERVYYSFQTEGRGFLDAVALRELFEQKSLEYDELLAGYLPADRSISCVDLACGYGNFLFALRKWGYSNLIGFDFDEKQVGLARMLDLPAEIADIDEVCGQLSEIGLISAIDLIEHLSKDDAVRLLERLRAALAPSGLLILRCPCADGLTGAHDLCNDLTHKWAPTSNALRQLLRAVGFARVEILDLGMPRFPKGIKSRAKLALRRSARRVIGLAMRAAGLYVPTVWTNSQIAVAWQGNDNAKLTCSKI